jgi:hypothetical protein
MSRPRWLVTAAVAGATLITASGCVPTGERPSLGEEVATGGAEGGHTGVPVVDALLDRLDAVSTRTFTAEYQITRKLGGITAEAAVAQSPPRRTVRIGDTVFLTGEQVEDQTCSTATNQCEAGIIEQRISDLGGISSGFYGPSPAQALRIAVGRRSGDPTASTRDVGGVTADCVAVPVGAGTETYCVSPQGPIAYVDTAAFTVALTAASDTADPAALAPPPSMPSATDGAAAG